MRIQGSILATELCTALARGWDVCSSRQLLLVCLRGRAQRFVMVALAFAHVALGPACTEEGDEVLWMVAGEGDVDVPGVKIARHISISFNA